jgi:hypothetical protein
MAANLTRARDDTQDTQNRGRAAQPNPVYQTMAPNPLYQPGITDADIRALKQKFSFLSDYTDTFIRNATPECLVKLESTNLKMREAEKGRDVDERLAQNRMAASSHPKEIGPGLDDRCAILHEARFLPGAVCSTVKLWLAARQVLGLAGGDPLASLVTYLAAQSEIPRRRLRMAKKLLTVFALGLKKDMCQARSALLR